jgi:hypothetical protein
LRKLHESINKRQGPLILITLEHIEYLQVNEVTKGYLSQISEEGEVKKAAIQGRITSFDDAF